MSQPISAAFPTASRGCMWSFIGLQGAVWGLSPEADGAQWSSEAVVAETAAFHLAAVLNVAAGGF